VGPYQLQAAIAALHAHANTFDQTDWTEIAALYVRLADLSPSPVVTLNHAVAVAMSEGPERGLVLIDTLESSGELSDYYLLHAARADLLRRLGRKPEAADAYTRALRLARNPIEQNYLRRRLVELDFTEG
jgi:RNA polymerase sigma-70 factor (ECF subfamily)